MRRGGCRPHGRCCGRVRFRASERNPGVGTPMTIDPDGVKNELIALIEPCGEEITDAVADAILSRGQAVVPALIDLLEDEELAQADSRGDGYLPVHAAWLLAKLRAQEAIAPMVRRLARVAPLELLFIELVHQLKSFGPPVLEPALAEWAKAGTPDAREGIENVLAAIGVRDERILSALLARLDVQPVLGAMLLAEYGDRAALPRLSAALDACAVDPSGGLLANGELIELEAAITGLGGTLSESQAQKVGTVLGDWEARPSDQLADDDAPERRSTDAERRRKKAQRKMKKKAQRRNRR